MIDASRVQNGFADSDLPKRMREDDKDVDLNELDVVLAPGSIHMTGEVTVIDAVLGSIDVDADFTVDVGFHWTPNGALNADGVQRMEHHIIGEPDVDPHGSVAFWIIAIILAVISFGAGSVLIGIIIIVVAAIITAIAEGVGGTALVDGVTGAVSGITAWPPELSRIGSVRAVFSDPIDIDTTGLVMSGTLEVVSSCESVQVVPADSGSAYSVAAASPLLLKAQREDPQAAYAWLAGDGAASVAAKSVTHTYIESGTYVAITRCLSRCREVPPAGTSRLSMFATYRPPSTPARTSLSTKVSSSHSWASSQTWSTPTLTRRCGSSGTPSRPIRV